MSIARSIERFLRERSIDYDVVCHEPTVTAMHTAASAHIPGDRLAKSVLLRQGDRYLMAVIPSTRRIDLDQLSKQLHAYLSLAEEAEAEKLFSDCDRGALPPVGAAYGIDTVVDDSLLEQPEVYFEGGDHEALIHMSWGQFNALMTGAGHGQFSYHV